MSFESLTKVSGIVLAGVGSAGSKTLVSQYYDDLIPESERQAFEQEIVEKVGESEGLEVLQISQCIAVFRIVENFVVIVFGSLNSNELLFDQIVTTICDALELIFQGPTFDILEKQIIFN